MQPRQDIGLDPNHPYVEGSPLQIRVPIAVCGLAGVVTTVGYTARWQLRPYDGFAAGDPVLEKSSSAGISNSGFEFVIEIAKGETTGLRNLHRQEMWIANSGIEFPVMSGDIQITPSRMAPPKVTA